MELVGMEEIFGPEYSATEAVIWHLVNLLGGKVVIPIDEDYWNMAIEPGVSHRLVLREEDGRMVLVAEKRSWQAGS